MNVIKMGNIYMKVTMLYLKQMQAAVVIVEIQMLGILLDFV